MASSSSVVGWSLSLCVAHRCSVLLRSSAMPIASPRPALPHSASRSVVKAKASDTTECAAMVNTNSRKDFLGLALGISSLFVGSLEAKGADLSPEDKPKLCDEACENEHDNVAANYVAMVSFGQVFDRWSKSSMCWLCWLCGILSRYKKILRQA
ncbi:hypothetical protein HN873_015791 [Arachis hypogaea]